MKSLALRLYGANDLRLERFDLPEITDDEILADIVTNSICMSDYKATIQGAGHKRVPKDIDVNPIILGHEFCGKLLKVGKNWQHKFRVGQKYGVQPQLNIPGHEHWAPGYSFRWIGGNATRIVIPREVLELDCLLTYDGDAYYKSSIAEPVSCIVGAYRCSYHFKAGEYNHQMGIKNGGSMVILAGAGPMGLSAIDLALHGPEHRPGRLVITDIDQARLDRAAQIFPVEHATSCGVDLHYVNTAGQDDPVAFIKAVNNNQGYDDVMVFAPVPALIEQGSALLAYLGCLNFFAGPAKVDFKASINFYDVHYMGHHVIGSSGGNTQDLQDSMNYAAQGLITPSVMITHVGGIDSVAETTQNLPNIPGGKKLVYTHVSMPMTAIEDFGARGEKDPYFAALAEICGRNKGLWCTEAERYVLTHAPRREEDA
ncbi:MAG: zinc-binding dehydrogenase [Kiritimatiellia bacterium]|jgi:threonine dehydrogenase-like Zn-dependent dehydrogenase|nr:zinc-binding dehydrogenase [Kiritimatiellia bacterium]MDD4173416.1 zinc-binding dehydrogenase [Kiritimatiellia bacterium]MDD4440685.1 zinc-binding dehydrogenase [Kiritimatiellia bacterium]MDX9792913.1 zinc-binding dehydrogenase [Kiritimatiellia bacterium]NLC82426.1 zinc-binding dehydrogenase [Lentisphaerota bacterium]